MKTYSSFLLIFLVFLLPKVAISQMPVWGFNLGGTSTDYGHSVKVAPNGNTYICGRYSGTIDLDPGPGTHNITSAGLDDIYLACYTTNGNFLWGFGIGGDSHDAAWQMTTDNSNNVIIVGWIQSPGIDFDPGADSFILPYSGGSNLDYYGDGFVAKYSSTGSFLWAKSLGGWTVYDHGVGVGTDALGNVYVAGEFDDTMTLVGGPTVVSGDNGQAYLIKYTAGGVLQWAHNFGLPGTVSSDCIPWGMRVDKGNIYLAGIFQGTSTFDPWGLPAHLTSVGTYDGFIAKYDTSGAFKFVKQVIGSGYVDEPLGLALDSIDNMYITGLSNSTSMSFNASSIGTSTVMAPGGGGNNDIFIAKYDSNGVYKWGKMMGGPGDDAGWAAEVVNKYVYFTGHFEQIVDMDPSPGNVANLVSTGMKDIFVAKFDLDGNYICSFRAGSPGTDDIGYGLTHDAHGQLIATGQFGGSGVNFDPSGSPFLLTGRGDIDAYIVKYNWTGLSIPEGTGGTKYTCSGTGDKNVDAVFNNPILVPTAFIINNSAGDKLKLLQLSILKLELFTIFNRWGEKVFETTDIETGWDGKYKGVPVQEGVYVYQILGQDSDQSHFVKHGNITLLK